MGWPAILAVEGGGRFCIGFRSHRSEVYERERRLVPSPSASAFARGHDVCAQQRRYLAGGSSHAAGEAASKACGARDGRPGWNGYRLLSVPASSATTKRRLPTLTRTVLWSCTGGQDAKGQGDPVVSDTSSLFVALREAADGHVVDRIERVLSDGADRELNRINPIAFAAAHALDEEKAIAAFLHAARLGIFELAWNVLCPGCGGVLDTGVTLKTVKRDQYHCALCAAGYEPTLDEMVEVTFTVSPRVRRIGAHDPNRLPPFEYYRQVFFSSGVDLPENFES